MKSKTLLIGVGVAIGLAIVLAGWQFVQSNYKLHGSVIDPAIPAADFTLVDQNGASFRLSDQSGKIVLIFFGYTHCPDVCPVTLSQFKQIKKQLGKKADQVRFVFITVDPDRDTMEELRRYVPNFDPDFIGLTGSTPDLEKVWKSYGVFSEKQPADSQGNYMVDHTARTYLVDQQGNWRLTYPFGIESSQMIADLEHLLRSQ